MTLHPYVNLCCAPGQPDLWLSLYLILYTQTSFQPGKPPLMFFSNLECPKIFAEHLLRARRCSGHQEYKDDLAGPLPSSPTSAHQSSSVLQACLRQHLVSLCGTSDQQHRQSLGSCGKCRASGLSPDLLNQNLPFIKIPHVPYALQVSEARGWVMLQ